MNNNGNARLQPGPEATPERGDPRGWHSRGYIPHFESAEVIQHVTYHLADSLPAPVLARFEDEVREMPPEQKDFALRKRLQDWIDAGHGSCVLREPEVAEMVQASFLHFDGERYRLFAWVVMPNHVHVLFQPLGEWTMAKTIASWKSFTGRRIRAFMDNWERQAPAWQKPAWQQTRQVWQRDYWDRFMRNEQHFATAMAYIHNNPVKAGLVKRAEDWPWSSARVTLAALERGDPREE